MTTRRDFLSTSGATLALAVIGKPALHLPGRRRYDMIVRGGTVFDGTGRDGFESDVALVDGRVVAIAPRLADDARDVIDARGLAVAPGFIDIHSHADGTLFRDPRAESVIRQGVTTVVVGQDGDSRAPRAASTPRATIENAAASFDGMFRAIDALGSSINVASMVGLGAVRHLVIGDADRPATEDELRQMTALVEAALQSGACGASSGLEYTPGEFASRDELVALCRPLASRGLPYATHMRNEDDRLVEAIDEAIAVARGAHCPLQISHLKAEGKRNWGKLDAAFGRIDDAKRGGIDVAFDRYPYVAYQTGLSNLFPKWSEDGGTDAFLGRLRDPALTSRLRPAVEAKIDLLGGWDNVLISSVSDSADRAAEGARLGSYARTLGRDPYDVTVALLLANRGDVGMVGFGMNEQNLARILAHPLSMICSDGGAAAVDGPAHSGHPHPRALGSFPRVLGKYVREERVLPLAQAIYKMTGFPASRIRLRDRGRLAVGAAGDVVVFDAGTVQDRATFTDPFQYPTGIRAVVVNGAIAVQDGRRAERGTGRALRV